MTQFPETSFQTVKDGTFEQGFEKFLADQTPFRTFFVSLNSYFELIKGNNGSAGVYLGKDGWLIEKPFDRENNFDKNLRRINDFSKTVDKPVYLLIAPTKGSIYTEYLPSNSLDYYDKELITSVSEKAGNINNINIVSAFEKNKNDTLLYYKTDHHWTTEGAFIAYNAVCDALNLNAVDISSYNKEIVKEFYGTSYSTSCYTLTKPDTLTIMRNAKTNGSAKVIIEDGSKPEEYDNMFFEDALETADKYVVFLNGNHGLERIITGNSGGKLLLVKDSFAHCIAPFLAENFSEIIMVDLRYYKKPLSGIIQNENPDQIMFLYGIDTFAESNDIILK
ncbi:MAG: hypothetical protein IKH13_08480 [Clostridia bacterium]|nr:hypothetical protein [Clostridia bacterium]